MSDRVRVEKGKYGEVNLRCRMPHVTWSYSDDDEMVGEARECGELVTLIWNLTGDVLRMVTPSEVGEWAVCSRWTVECGQGHVLATSDGEESAEAFDSLLVLGLDDEALE